MNKHQEEADKLVMEIMAAAFALQVKTDYAVFIDFAGHVDTLKISIRESAKDYVTIIAETEFGTTPRPHLDTQREFDDWLEDIKSKHETIKRIAIDCEIDTDYMYEVVHKTYSYSF